MYGKEKDGKEKDGKEMRGEGEGRRRREETGEGGNKDGKTGGEMG